MANLIPVVYPKPNPLNIASGKSIREGNVEPILQSSNWLLANHGHRDVVVACFPFITGSWYAEETNTGYPSEPNAVYRIPYVEGVDTALLRVYAPSEADQAGTIRVNSGDGNVDLAIPGAGFYDVDVPLGFHPDGYSTFKIYTKADAGKTLYIQSLTISYPEADGPLPAGQRSDDSVPFDQEEFNPNKPMSADVEDFIIGNLEALAETHQTYIQWSGWRVTGGTTEFSRMASLPTMWVCPVWHETDMENYNLEVYVRAEGTDVDSQIVIGVGDTFNPSRQVVKKIAVASGSGEIWYHTTIKLRRHVRIQTGAPPGYDTILVSIWPESSSSEDNSIEQSMNVRSDRLSTATILSVSAWGV